MSDSGTSSAPVALQPPSLRVSAEDEWSRRERRGSLSAPGAPNPGVVTDYDRWGIAATLKRAALEGDDAVARELGKLPPIVRLAYQIADTYAVATPGFSAPLLYARGGGAVEALLLEFQDTNKK